MTRDDIIRMAREAHGELLASGKGMYVWHGDAYAGDVQDFCERFAALVAAAEREACAKVCDEVGGRDTDSHAWDAAAALRAALAEEAMQRLTDVQQEIEAALAEPVQEPEQFDHGIGDDRFKVVRGAYWWHVLIGDGTKKYGKFHTQAGAEEMATLLLREFKNGAFVQHRERCREGPTAALMADLRAALAEPEQEPVAWRFQSAVGGWAYGSQPPLGSKYPAYPLYTAPLQRKPLTDEEIEKATREVWRNLPSDFEYTTSSWVEIGIRYAERAHGIGD